MQYATALEEIVQAQSSGESVGILAMEAYQVDPDFVPRIPYMGRRAFTEADTGDLFGRTAGPRYGSGKLAAWSAGDRRPAVGSRQGRLDHLLHGKAIAQARQCGSIEWALAA